MWQSPFGPGGSTKEGRKGERWHQGTFWRKRGTQSEMLIEKKRKSIKRGCLIDSLPRCFLWRCQRTAQLLSPVLPCSFCFPLSPSLCLIHHLPPHPSSHCRLLLNVSPNSPNISLTFHSIVPPPQLSLAHPPIFSLCPSCILLTEMHSSPAIKATGWHSFNLVVL